MKVSMIVAHDNNRCIGKKNDIPWSLPADLQYFKSKTLGSTLIMGRITFDSIGRPLPGRETIVISRDVEAKQREYSEAFPGAVTVCGSLHRALEIVRMSEQPSETKQVSIVGGGNIYGQALELDVTDTLYITEVDTDVHNGDTYFPVIDLGVWELVDAVSGTLDKINTIPHTFKTYKKRLS